MKRTMIALGLAAMFALGYGVGKKDVPEPEVLECQEKGSQKLERLQDIILADANIGSTEYAYESRTPYHDGTQESAFGHKTYKCNLYVHNMLKEMGLPAPQKENPSSDGVTWPLQAADWASRTLNIPHWEVVRNGSLQAGDVISYRKHSKGATGHVGIVVETPSGYGVVSARNERIVLDQFCTRGGKAKENCTIRRYVK